MTVLCTLELPYKMCSSSWGNTIKFFFRIFLFLSTLKRSFSVLFLVNNVIYPSIFINEKFCKYTTI